MPKKLVVPPVPTTPADTGSTLGRRTLPDDVLREASRRLEITALLSAAIWVFATVADHLAMRAITHGDPQWLRLDMDDVIATTSIAASLAIYAYIRKANRSPEFVLNLGLVYMVVMAFDVALLIHWDPIPSDFPIFPMITWVGAIVLMFAAIVPNTPGKTLVASFIAVSMTPLSMLVAKARGTWDFGPTSNVLVMHYPDYLLVIIAVVISHVFTRLGQKVAKAREMGSYQLGELIGRGGMGEVYQATHRMLARPAAIKLIRPEMIKAAAGEAGQIAVTRFRREAQAAANLRSPHTVELYDFGVTDDHTLYFVMELLDGMDLETLVRRYGRVPANRVIHILRQVCESLEEAHASGLVHRDIKPANIHVGRLGRRHDFVKVLDFGLVKSVAGATGEDSLATAAGLTPGTPSYMAPEMASGTGVDGRADIYALGCVAYYLMTGKTVFEGNALQVISKHLGTAPVPPTQRAGISLPPGLESLVLACLAKDPDARPRTAEELADKLAAIHVEPWGEAEAAHWWQTVPRHDVA
ncbi:MAG TPA: serine/threonine-protein kinase [Gemmatimonadales bacterium]|jgi:serine/threonine-protein kinase